MTCLGFINTFSDKRIWINKRTLQESGCWSLMGKPFLMTDSWWHLLLHETVSSFPPVIRQMMDVGEGHPQVCPRVKPQVSAWSCYTIRVGEGLWGGEEKMKYSWGSNLGNWLSSTGTAYFFKKIPYMYLDSVFLRFILIIFIYVHVNVYLYENMDGGLQWLWRPEEGVSWSYSTWQGCWELSSLKEPSERTQMPWNTKPLTGSYTWTKLLFSLSFWDNFLHSQHLRAATTQRQKLPLTRQLLSSSVLRQ